ncbi:MAG: hypothetical protein OEX19_00430 [Gammaproteobacteria bacterium]|nr:hypothetical protein [Gammaproteobacteria bacterium]
MYFVLAPKPDSDGNIMGFTYKKDHPLRSWMGGNKFSKDESQPVFKKEPTSPIRVQLKKGRETVQKADYLEAPLPIISERLYFVLKEAGVDNIDVYPMEICDEEGLVLYDDYFAVNIIGKVSAVDIEKSISDEDQADSMISKSFDSLAINEDAANGLKLFRLAENVGVVLVNENIKNILTVNKFETIELLEPENIAAL